MGFIQQHGSHLKDSQQVTIYFNVPFTDTPTVVVSPYWRDQSSEVGHAETIIHIDPKYFTLASGNQALSYHVNWIAIGEE
jgi:hypothetical protein